MLDKAKTLKGYTLRSTDGDIGSVKDFYFDDQYWTIRYLVAETGHWLTGRQVLLSPYALHHVGREEGYIAVALTKKQIENGPPLDRDKPEAQRLFDAGTHIAALVQTVTTHAGTERATAATLYLQNGITMSA